MASERSAKARVVTQNVSPLRRGDRVEEFLLSYQTPYDFPALLAFFSKRAIPGIESVSEHDYRRIFVLDDRVGMLSVESVPGADALRLRIDLDGGVTPAIARDITARIRRMFDLDADIANINAHLGRRRHLKSRVARNPGQRLPGGWDGFEIAIRAVLGQQVTVAAGRTLTERVVRKFGREVTTRQNEKVYLFPKPEMLAEAGLSGLGITGARIATLRGIARAIVDGRVDFRADRPLDEFVAMWTALPGIGEWTAHYLAMRGLAHADAFPAADIILRKAVSRDDTPVPTKTLEQMSQAWRPYRAYAVLHLWRAQ